MEPRRPTSMVRAAVRPRMLVLLVVLLAAAAACGLLGAWQLERSQSRAEQVQRQEAVLRDAAPPDPLDAVLLPQTSFDGGLLGRAVTVTGVYEADGQLVVPDRSLDGRTGAIVLTPLRVVGGAGDGAVLPVARGWVPSAAAAAPPPAGPVTLTGRLQPSEAAGALDLAAGTVEAISAGQLVNVWGGPAYSGYLVVAESSAAQEGTLERLPPPQPRGGSGWDLRNLGYALQWWIFGLFAVALWVRLVRDEAAGEPVPDADGSAAAVREPAGGASA